MSPPTFRPFADNVLVLPDWLRDRRKERRSAGGIVLPASERPGDYDAVMATVVSVGPGAYDDPIRHDDGIPGAPRVKLSKRFVPVDVQPGDRVLVQHAIQGEPYIVDGVEHRIVRAGNIVGVVTEEGPVGSEVAA